MLLDEVAIYLQGAGMGTVGVSLYKGAVPLDGPGLPVQDAIIVLIPVPGLPPVHIHNQVACAYEQPVLQILTRGAPYDFEETALRAHAVFATLDGLSNLTIGQGQYLWISAMQSPFSLPYDSSNRPIIVFNVRCARGDAP
jgi:hypothetical protein